MRHAARVSVVLLSLLSVPSSRVLADSIFDYPGIPAHAGHYSWTDGVPHFHQHHFHNTTHDAGPNDARPGHDVAHQLSGNGDYDAYSHWVNETYNYFDDPGENSLFGHGFIIEQPGPTPEYRFEGDVAVSLFDHTGAAFDARSLIRAAFDAWSNITTDDPTHLVMGLAFREFVSVADAAEIIVSAVDYIAGAVAVWDPVAKTLKFRRYDHETERTDEQKHRWFNTNSGVLADDRTAFEALVAPAGKLDDFFTVALHEVGHIVGLDHQADIDDVLETLAGAQSRVKAGGTFRTLSDDDILGARDLYSIPVPEPSSLLMASFAVVAGLRRWRSAL